MCLCFLYGLKYGHLGLTERLSHRSNNLDIPGSNCDNNIQCVPICSNLDGSDKPATCACWL